MNDSYCFCKGLRKTYKTCWQSTLRVKGPCTDLQNQWIIFICLHIARSTIIIRFPDIDGLHSPFSLYAEFGRRDFVWYQEQVTRGISSMWRKLQAEGNDFCNVLPALHTYIGCDTTSALVRKGKITHLLISLVSLIFSVFWKIFWHATSHVEHFVCMLYDRYSTTTIWSYVRFASSKVCR